MGVIRFACVENVVDRYPLILKCGRLLVWLTQIVFVCRGEVEFVSQFTGTEGYVWSILGVIQLNCVYLVNRIDFFGVMQLKYDIIRL